MITAIGIERTADGKDYKLTVSKGSSLFKQAEFRAPAAERGPAATEEAPTQPDELVRHFHKVFHGLDDARPQSKELSHATALIAQHGFDRAKYIVDYAHIAAPRTGYFPQTVGGIMQYASSALASYEGSVRTSGEAARASEQAKARHAFEELQAEAQGKRWKDAEARLASLKADEYDALATRVKADLQGRSRWLKQSDSSPFFQRAIRAAMVSELMSQAETPNGESMDGIPAEIS